MSWLINKCLISLTGDEYQHYIASIYQLPPDFITKKQIIAKKVCYKEVKVKVNEHYY